jgi:hypothetical protein
LTNIVFAHVIVAVPAGGDDDDIGEPGFGPGPATVVGGDDAWLLSVPFTGPPATNDRAPAMGDWPPLVVDDDGAAGSDPMACWVLDELPVIVCRAMTDPMPDPKPISRTTAPTSSPAIAF